jgi:uncharacterized protein HemX
VFVKSPIQTRSKEIGLLRSTVQDYTVSQSEVHNLNCYARENLKTCLMIAGCGAVARSGTVHTGQLFGARSVLHKYYRPCSVM